eukprot:2562216-Pleurochrysis_carterae.AAC.1
MRTSAWWRTLADATARTGAAGGTLGPGQDDPQPAATAAAPESAPSMTAAAGAQGGAQAVWRADVASFVARGARASGARAAGAEDVADRAAALGLAGPLGEELAD